MANQQAHEGSIFKYKEIPDEHKVKLVAMWLSADQIHEREMWQAQVGDTGEDDVSHARSFLPMEGVQSLFHGLQHIQQGDRSFE